MPADVTLRRYSRSSFFKLFVGRWVEEEVQEKLEDKLLLSFPAYYQTKFLMCPHIMDLKAFHVTIICISLVLPVLFYDLLQCSLFSCPDVSLTWLLSDFPPNIFSLLLYSSLLFAI